MSQYPTPYDISQSPYYNPYYQQYYQKLIPGYRIEIQNADLELNSDDDGDDFIGNFFGYEDVKYNIRFLMEVKGL